MTAKFSPSLHDKSQITILLVCRNEGRSIGSAINKFKKAKFSRFLVIDDNSTDDTASMAKEAGAAVVTSKISLGFNLAVLKGLYLIETQAVLIVPDPNINLDAAYLNSFMEFGMLGEYPILLPHGKIEYGIDFSKILKRKYGVFLSEPGFQAVFLNRQMLEITKKRVTGASPYIFFELIKAAVTEDLKIGVLESGITEVDYGRVRHLRIWLWRQRRKRERKDYIRLAFPDLIKKEVRRRLVIGTLIAGIGGAMSAGLIWITVQLADTL